MDNYEVPWKDEESIESVEKTVQLCNGMTEQALGTAICTT